MRKDQIRIQGISCNGTKGMLDYYSAKENRPKYPTVFPVECFDPIQYKYNLKEITDGCLDRNHTPSLEQYSIHPDSMDDMDRLHKQQYVYERLYSFLRNYEESKELASLTKKDFSHVMENLYMIYNTDDAEIKRVVRLIHLVSQKVINEYIQIDGLERLFCEQYIDFEWEMHLGMDHTKHTMKFYRDHFIHQVRDAYMMDRLLTDGGFYRRVYDKLSQPGNSKVSAYFCKMVERQKQVMDSMPNARLLKYDREFIPRNIIYMASYMAGLFHDIGYPETYLQSLRRRTFSFMPGMHAGDMPRDTLTGGMFSLLQNSLLFRVVPFDEIQRRVYSDSIDHGTLSAVAFLLHFYTNGMIFNLPPYKAAAVELAALAIYNHTYVYSIASSDKKHTDDCRPRFSSNPISYLLRICDDLQEWDRVYFEISSRSNISICSHCHTPLVGQPVMCKSKNTPGLQSKQIRYVCNCYAKGEQGHFARMFDGLDTFPYRRLYNVRVCDYVDMTALHKSTLENASDLCFHLQYDPYRLLHIAYIRPSYARYRIEELNKLKPLLAMQSGLPRIWLDYFVTANPILIKANLLGEYFEALMADGRPEPFERLLQLERGAGVDMENDFKPTVEALLSLLGNDLAYLEQSSSGQSPQTIREQVLVALRLYSMLYLYGKLCLRISERENGPQPCLQPVVDEIRRIYSGSPAFECLLGDSLLQLSRLYDREKLAHQPYIPEIYLQQFAPGNWLSMLTGKKDEPCSVEFYHSAVEWYLDPEQYQPVCWTRENPQVAKEVDAFTDLGFFQYIRQKQ